MLSNMFSRDFGDQISRYTTLVDPNNNEFQVLVERFNSWEVQWTFMIQESSFLKED